MLIHNFNSFLDIPHFRRHVLNVQFRKKLNFWYGRARSRLVGK